MATTTAIPDAAWWRSPLWVPIEMGTGVIECISCLMCILYAVYKVHRGYSKLTSMYIILTLGGTSCFLVSAVATTINGYYYNSIHWAYTPIQWNSWILMWAFWSFGQIVSYILFMNRLQTIFKKGGPYMISTRQSIFIYTSIAIYIIIWSISCWIPMYLLNTQHTTNENHSEQDLWTLQWYLACITLVFDIIISTSITYLFVTRLYRLDSFDRQATEIKIVEEKQCDQKPSDLRSVAMKIAILSISSLVSSLLTVLFRGMSYFLLDLEPNDLWLGIFVNLLAFWLQIDTILSSICLILFLPNTQYSYNIFCYCCIAICSKYDQHRNENHKIAQNESNLVTSINMNTSKTDNSCEDLE